jgi:CRP-like cAMP-binding protein
MSVVERYADGEVIVRQGEMGREMYVIQHGAVEVVKSFNGRAVVLATLGRGSFFGEMSLLESLPRAATVRAKGDTQLLVIEPGGLLLKIRRDPTFAFEMLQHMSRRIRDLDEQLMHLLNESDRVESEAEVRISGVVKYRPETAGESSR